MLFLPWIYTELSVKAGERKKEWEKKRERSSGDPKTLRLVLFWLHAFNSFHIIGNIDILIGYTVGFFQASS